MKRYMLFACALLPLAGCSPGEPDLDAEVLRELAAHYTAAWNHHDAARVASFHRDDSSLTINDGEPAVGSMAITASAEAYLKAFPDMVLEMDSLVIRSDTVEYHWTFTGTNTGPGGTGNAVRLSGYEAWTIGDEGLIAASKGHYDEAEYARQLESGVDGE